MENDQGGNSWGNRSAVRATLKSAFFPYHNPYVHSLQNEETFPVQVWALVGASAKVLLFLGFAIVVVLAFTQH